MTKSSRSTLAELIWFKAERYCIAKLCNCRRHVSSGTAIVSVPSTNVSAVARSAIFEPQASGHASRGASLPSRQTFWRKIFRSVEAACCIA